MLIASKMVKATEFKFDVHVSRDTPDTTLKVFWKGGFCKNSPGGDMHSHERLSFHCSWKRLLYRLLVPPCMADDPVWLSINFSLISRLDGKRRARHPADWNLETSGNQFHRRRHRRLIPLTHCAVTFMQLLGLYSCMYRLSVRVSATACLVTAWRCRDVVIAAVAPLADKSNFQALDCW